MAAEETFEHHLYDVVVIGAGGAGLRAAIAAQDAGARTALICRSLLGKAHTVMAEGGIAAALGNVWPEDNWQVHFRDTMRGGKLLNHWRMAELHAKEAPDRVYELEQWGALFDRTQSGKISQRDFGGHRYARLAHVGDRTGLEMIRALQQRAVSIRHRRVHGAYDHRPAERRRQGWPARLATGGSRDGLSCSKRPLSCWLREASENPGK
jgi:succinate dehydrogenase / fumarate reductase flavoprotein subunit